MVAVKKRAWKKTRVEEASVFRSTGTATRKLKEKGENDGPEPWGVKKAHEKKKNAGGPTNRRGFRGGTGPPFDLLGVSQKSSVTLRGE